MTSKVRRSPVVVKGRPDQRSCRQRPPSLDPSRSFQTKQKVRLSWGRLDPSFHSTELHNGPVARLGWLIIGDFPCHWAASVQAGWQSVVLDIWYCAVPSFSESDKFTTSLAWLNQTGMKALPTQPVSSFQLFWPGWHASGKKVKYRDWQKGLVVC